MSSTDRVGWIVALITGVLAVLSFLGLDKQSRAWICQGSDGRFLCDKVRIEDVQVRVFALDYCYLHGENCMTANAVSTQPLLANDTAMVQLNADLRGLGNPNWEHEPPDNLRFYVPNHTFPRGTSQKYLLYWELNFNAAGLDHPVSMRIVPYLYLPVPPGSEGYYGDPYDRAYQATDTVNFVLKPGKEKVSHLLTVDSGQNMRLENVNDWPLGVYAIKFKIESEQVEMAHSFPISDTFEIYQMQMTPPINYSPNASDNYYQYGGY